MSMDYFWVATVSLHLLAAVMWIGGMLFLSVVFAPLVRNGNPMFPAVFRAAAQRFRPVVWTAMAVLVMTGLVLVHQRGVSLADLAHWPKVLQIKIGLVGVLFLLTFAHSLLSGSRVGQIKDLSDSTRTMSQLVLLQTSQQLPRFALLVALGVLVTAVVLARS
jgi:copper resistance protein D